ncbi:MAG: ribE [Dehalococcoidia bacterium]|nr:ribE [Dehalococcoidia bacterium]
MFTGIIEELGTVKSLGGGVLVISARKALEGAKLGDSIAVNGACLTVTSLDDSSFSVSLMPETMRVTSLGDFKPGDLVNLERALAVGDRLGGSIVQGHVEGVGRLVSLTPEGDAVIATYSAPKELMRYIVPKGFIAIDGVSLTVVKVDGDTFTVSLVQYTQENTNLVKKNPGAPVNLETDIIGRYVEALLRNSGAPYRPYYNFFRSMEMEEKTKIVLKHLEFIEEEIISIKKLLMSEENVEYRSLYGIWKGIDVTEEDIQEAKRSLFPDRDL